jgi:hypothetical protein
MKFKKIQAFIFIFITCFSINIFGYEVDTTQTRDIKKPTKKFSSYLLELPQEIIRIPIRILKEITHGIVYSSTSTGLYESLKNPSPYGKISPIIGYDPTRYGLQFGGGFKWYDSYMIDDEFMLELLYSTNKYHSYTLRYRSFKDEKLNNFEITSYYKKKTRERFYGLGNYSKKINEANFTDESIYFGINYNYRGIKNTLVNFNVSYNNNNYYNGQDDKFESDLVDITNNQVYNIDENFFLSNQYIVYGIGVTLKTSNHSGQPSDGVLIKGKIKRFNAIKSSSDLNFNKFTLELNKYFDLWRKRIFTLRFKISHIDKPDNINLPFSVLNYLGSIDILRAYSEDRYIDNDIALIAIEYRYPIFDNIDAFIFFEQGRTFSDIFDEKFLVDWKYSTGFGMRIWNKNGVRFMPLIADGFETMKFYFVLGANW